MMFYQIVSYDYCHLKFLEERKAIYDQYGEYGLKEGIPDGKGCTYLSHYFIAFKGGYRYAGNSHEIYEKFFGGTNPFFEKLEDDGRDMQGSMFGDAFGGQNHF